MPSHRFPFEYKLIAVVHESIEDGIGNGAIAEVGMPLVDRDLTGFTGSASVFSLVFGSGVAAAEVPAFVDRLTLFRKGFSWGGGFAGDDLSQPTAAELPMFIFPLIRTSLAWSSRAVIHLSSNPSARDPD
jgi:hypothetical protein